MALNKEIIKCNPKVLVWARKTIGLSLADATNNFKKHAKIFREDENFLAKIESGQELPTISFLNKAVKEYQRPLAAFLLPSPPPIPKFPDFRTNSEQRDAPIGKELLLWIRRCRVRQDWLSQYLKDKGQTSLDWVASASEQDDVLQLAGKIRSKLAMSLKTQQGYKDKNKAMKGWIARVEDIGAFVCQSEAYTGYRPDTRVVRGFALSVDKIAPCIGINNYDSHAGRIFTLAHELVHLWIGKPGSSGSGSVFQGAGTESFCNKVAAEILLPQKEFIKLWDALKNYETEEKIKKIAKTYSLSKDMVALLALRKNFIKKEKYEEIVKKYRESFLDNKSKGGGGGLNVSIYTKLNHCGRLFARSVFSAYEDGYATYWDILRYTKARSQDVPKMREILLEDLR